MVIFSVFWELDRVSIMVVNWDQLGSNTNVKIQEEGLNGFEVI